MPRPWAKHVKASAVSGRCASQPHRAESIRETDIKQKLQGQWGFRKMRAMVIYMIRALCVSFSTMPAHFTVLLDCECLEGLMAPSAAPQAIAT